MRLRSCLAVAAAWLVIPASLAMAQSANPPAASAPATASPAPISPAPISPAQISPDQGAPAPTPPAPRSLEVLRGEIDRIDAGLLALFNQRATIVAEVGASKGVSGGPVFRPGRQAALLRKLLASNPGPQTADSLVRIWTAVIAGSILQQKPDFTVGVAGDDDAGLTAAQAYFGIPVRPLALPEHALSTLSEGRVDAVALPPSGEWWRVLAPDMRIIAAAPLLRAPTAPIAMLIVARRAVDPSGNDLTLVRMPEGSTDGAVIARAGGDMLVALGPNMPKPAGAEVLGLVAVPLSAAQ